VSSLAARLLLASALVLPLFLGATGWYLAVAHRAGLEAALAERLQLQVRALLAEVEVSARHLEVPGNLLEPRLEHPGSGLYALVLEGETLLWSSASSAALPLETLTGDLAPMRAGYPSLSVRDGLQRLSYPVLWEVDETTVRPLRFVVLETLAPLEAEAAAYRRGLLFWLGGSVLILLLCQAGILAWGLRPLHRLAAQLQRIEQGEQTGLQGPWPREVQRVTRALTSLLYSEQQRREQVRNTLGNLAHSLKTPLAVILSSDSRESAYPARVREQAEQMRDIIDWQLQRAQGGHHRWLQWVAVKPLLERLVASLRKVYADRELDIAVHLAPGLRFQGDERDVLEVLGNLLDNACKHARRHIQVSGGDEGAGGNWLQIDDDGPGIPTALREALLERGARADRRADGQGLGLAVAADIVASYDGGLSLEDSALGGLRVRVDWGRDAGA
jgi:two-component system sensor histidine kinase PhoQ